MAHEPEHSHHATATAVVEVGGLSWASEKTVVEAVVGRRPGVVAVEANPVAQTVTVTYDPARTSVVDLRDWVRDCGYRCRGQSVPSHICDPLTEPTRPDRAVHDGGHDHAPASTEPSGGEHGLTRVMERQLAVREPGSATEMGERLTLYLPVGRVVGW